MKNKIGILSFHRADNYGGILQVFALQKIVSILTTSDVEVINYEEPCIQNLKPIFPSLRVSIGYMREILQYLWRAYLYINPESKQKRAKFEDFRKCYLKISRDFFPFKGTIVGYDIYITGSDQVWNTSITKADSTFYLDFDSLNGKKVSYAASFGHEKLSKIEKEYVERFLPKFNFISVREDSAVKAIKDEIDIDSFMVLDPTLLLSKEQWLTICNVSNTNDFIKDTDYLLLYGLEVNEQMYQIARFVADKRNLKLIQITAPGFTHSKVQIDQKIKNAGPIEFLNILLNANFIVTNSFHGTAFAINFNKNFICVPHKSRGTRMASLLNTLRLNDKAVTELETVKRRFDFDVDFSNANELLKIERKKSLSFLNTAVSSK